MLLIKTPLCRPGGKSRFLNKILPLLPKHEKYVEPFAGSGALFFKKEPATNSVLNDKDKSIASIFKLMKKGGSCPAVKMTKKRFKQLLEKSNKTACDYLALMKASFACNMKGFAKSKIPKGKVREHNFSKYKDIMKNTEVTNKEFKEVVKDHDSKNTFFYVDPPYPSNGCVYPKKELCAITPQEVADILKNIKGKTLISYSDHPLVRDAFKKYLGWKIRQIKTKHIMCNNDNCGKQGRKELLISNY